MTRCLFSCIFVLASATASTQSSLRSRSVPFSGVRPVGIESGVNSALKPTRPAQTATSGTSQQIHVERQTDVKETSSSTFTPLLSKSIFVSCLAFLTGVGDVIAYRRYGCYANMMTGNTVRMTTALAELRLKDAALFGSLLISYAGGVSIFRAVDLVRKSRRPSNNAVSSHRPSCFAVAPMILSLFVLVDILVKMSGDLSFQGFIPLLSIGFGMLNAATSDALGGICTFAMTGHVSKLGQAVVDRFFTSGKKRWRKGSKTSARTLIFFGAGICAGVILSNRFGPALGNVPPFTILGVLYALLLGLHSISAPDFSQWPFGKMKSPSSGEDNINESASASLLDITMDGWTAMPAGPAPFQDGQ